MEWKEKWLESYEGLVDWLQKYWTALLVPLALALIVGFIVQSPLETDTPEYEVGEIASHDIKAPQKIIVVDEEETEARETSAHQSILPVFDYDSKAGENFIRDLNELFEQVRLQNMGRDESPFDSEQLSPKVWEILKTHNFNEELQSNLEEVIEAIYKNWISNQELGLNEDFQQFAVRDLFTEQEITTQKEVFEDRFLTTDEIPEKIREASRSRLTMWDRLSEDEQDALVEFLTKNIQSNISFNEVETRQRQEEALEEVEPALVEIASGEMILREGQKAEHEHTLLLEGLKEVQSKRADFRSYCGFVSLFLFLLIVLYWVGSRNFKKFKLNTRDRIVLSVFFVTSIALIAGFSYILEATQIQSPAGVSLQLLLPFAFVGMSLRLVTSIEITALFCFLFSLCVGWLLKDHYSSLIVFTATMAGAALMRHINQRLDVLKAGLFAGLIQGLAASIGAVLELVPIYDSGMLWLDTLWIFSLTIGSGILSAGIVLAIQPLLELLGYTTDLKLIELSSTNHPLLKELTMNAPGTYFHSFAVSQLSEKAAEAVNGNPLFARVASLYHDVGKLRKPQYFIENIKGENKHDRLVPTMSALIISNHVRDGIELAHQYKLPQGIVDTIPQHHGTSLITYFYEKAKQAYPHQKVDDRDFRYPGPKPQTKEAAIIMLADAVEATAKSMPQASLDQLRQKVNQTIKRFFLDGQLDECELSLKDLNAIGSAFIRVLQGIYHERIDYPESKSDHEETPSLADTQSRS